MFRVFRYVYVSTLCLIAALGFERAWSHELPPHYLDPDVNYQGSGHTAFPTANSICIDLAVEAYLFELAVPAAGTSCPAQPIHF